MGVVLGYNSGMKGSDTMKTDNACLLDRIAGRTQAKQAYGGRAVGGSLSSLLLSGMHKRSGVSFGGVSTVGGTGRALTVGGTGSGTVINPGRVNRGTTVGRMPKLAQYLGSANLDRQHSASRSMAEGDALKRRAAAEATAARSRQANIEKMPPAEQQAAAQKRFEAAQHNIKQRMSWDEVEKAVDAEGGVSPWGKTVAGRTVGSFVMGVPATVNALAGTGDLAYHAAADYAGRFNDWLRSRGTGRPYKPKPSMGYGQMLGDRWWNAFNTLPEDGGDFANNLQLNWNAAKHAGNGLWRTFVRYSPNVNLARLFMPKSLSDKISDLSQDNDWANASDKHYARQLRIMRSMNNPDLRPPEDTSNLSPLNPAVGNYLVNGAAGEYAAGEALTLGAGAVAKGLGKGIEVGTRTLGNWIRGADATADVAAAAARAAAPAAQATTWAGRFRRAWDATKEGAKYVKDHPWRTARHRLASGFEHVGNAVATPLRWAGNVAMPTAKVAPASASARAAGAIRGADAAADMASRAQMTAMRPPTYGPREWLRRVKGDTGWWANYAMHHPWRTARHLAASGLEHAGTVRSPTMNAANTAGRAGWQVAKDVGNTGKAFFYDPVHLLRNPAGRRLFRAHPWRMTGKWLYNTAKPFGRYPAKATKWFFSDNGWRDMAGAGAAAGVASGDLGSAWDSLADYGKLGLYGPLWTPYFLLHDVPQMVMGEDERK